MNHPPIVLAPVAAAAPVVARPVSSGSDLPRPRCPRFHSLDLWRGVACLMVVVYHLAAFVPDNGSAFTRVVCGFLHSLWTGVPIFFVISGYCIAATSDSTRRKPRAVKEFFLRRFRRIFPPYWIYLAVAFVIVVLCMQVPWPTIKAGESPFLNPVTLTAQQWLGTVTLTEPLRWHFFRDPYLMFMGHAWTLGYEEQFYAVCGLLLLLAPRRFFQGTLVVTALVLCVAPLSFKKVGGFDTFGFFFDGRWLLFAAGVLVYRKVNYASPRQARLVDLFLAGSVMASLALYLWALRRHQAGSLTEVDTQLALSFVIGAVTALVFALTHRWDRPTAAVRPLQPLFFCGRMCYSLYLIHTPLTIVVGCTMFALGVRGFWSNLVVTIPVGIAVSVSAAWVFHRLVERHFLNAPQTGKA